MSETVEMFKRCADAQWRGLPEERKLHLDLRALKHPDMAITAPGQPRAETPIWTAFNETTGRIFTLMCVKR